MSEDLAMANRRRWHCLLWITILMWGGDHLASACGPHFPNWLLVNPERNALGAPEALFDRELERLNRAASVFRAVPPTNHQFPQHTLEVELTDLKAAMTKSGMPTSQAEVVVRGHRAERLKITVFQPEPDDAETRPWPPSEVYVLLPDPTNATRITGSPPQVTPGLPAEFADYLRGSVAWHTGNVAAARSAWMQLLSRPPAERHYKSTWAIFMLAKSWEQENPDKAIACFRKVRELAADGFADTLGLATASLGWEARLHWRAGRHAQAIRLYLEQAAAGDPSAPPSLRFAASAALNQGSTALRRLARDPQVQRVITTYVISDGYLKPAIDVDGPLKEGVLKVMGSVSGKIPLMPAPNPAWHNFRAPALLWLEAVEAAEVKDVDSAEQLALAAYQAGSMDTAQRWLRVARPTPAAQWLQAKLLLRGGQVDEAAALLANVCRQFPVTEPRTNQAPAIQLAENLFREAGEYDAASMAEQARAELGLFHLSRRQYSEALDALLRSSSAYWMDASYVAERVLTLEELKRYVDAQWPPQPRSLKTTALPADRDAWQAGEAKPHYRPFGGCEGIRYLLGRRLTRAGRFAEATPYSPMEWQPMFRRLQAAWQTAEDTSKSKVGRGQALLEAARLTRRYGLELLGTEVEPDWAIHAGDYQEGVTVASRAAQQASKSLATTTEELQRATEHGVTPESRWHYRQVAAVMALEAARLLRDAEMPDQSPDARARILFDAAKFISEQGIAIAGGASAPAVSAVPARKGEDASLIRQVRQELDRRHGGAAAEDHQIAPPGATADALWTFGYSASALAWEAAKLLPDNSDQKAVVLCLGGTWIMGRDPQAADVLYKALVRRCRRTAIGAEADRLRWFPQLDKDGQLRPRERQP